MIYSSKTQHTQSSASLYGYMFRSLPRPSLGQNLSVKGTIGGHYTL